MTERFMSRIREGIYWLYDNFTLEYKESESKEGRVTMGFVFDGDER